VLLQDDSESLAGTTPEQLSRLLYAGEYFDANAQMYYNRARWYNPYNGRFNRTDPFAGNTQDPQSLHKYAYVHNNPVNGIDPTGMFSIGNVMTTVAIIGVLTGIFNTAISGVSLAYASEDDDVIPDGAIMSVSEVFGTHGFVGEGGFDIIWERKSRKLYAFLFGAAGFSPLSYFGRFRNSLAPSATVGLIYNMNSINDWSGTGMTASWPLSIIHLLPRAMFSKNKMWGALTQLAKTEHNIKNSHWTVQFQFSSSGPAAFKIGPRSNSFTSTGGLASRPFDLQSIGQSLGELLGPLYAKVMQLHTVCDNVGNAKNLAQ
jgi:RHS repeat-associated protein